MIVKAKFNVWKYICILFIVFIIIDYSLDYAFDEYFDVWHYYEMKD
jgi:hypothetical protein